MYMCARRACASSLSLSLSLYLSVHTRVEISSVRSHLNLQLHPSPSVRRNLDLDELAAHRESNLEDLTWAKPSREGYRDCLHPRLRHGRRRRRRRPPRRRASSSSQRRGLHRDLERLPRHHTLRHNDLDKLPAVRDVHLLPWTHTGRDLNGEHHRVPRRRPTSSLRRVARHLELHRAAWRAPNGNRDTHAATVGEIDRKVHAARDAGRALGTKHHEGRGRRRGALRCCHSPR